MMMMNASSSLIEIISFVTHHINRFIKEILACYTYIHLYIGETGRYRIYIKIIFSLFSLTSEPYSNSTICEKISHFY